VLSLPVFRHRPEEDGKLDHVHEQLAAASHSQQLLRIL
jgi:hypothetical protein